MLYFGPSPLCPHYQLPVATRCAAQHVKARAAQGQIRATSADARRLQTAVKFGGRVLPTTIRPAQWMLDGQTQRAGLPTPTRIASSPTWLRMIPPCQPMLQARPRQLEPVAAVRCGMPCLRRAIQIHDYRWQTTKLAGLGPAWGGTFNAYSAGKMDGVVVN